MDELRVFLDAKTLLKKQGASDIISPDELFDFCLKFGLEVCFSAACFSRPTEPTLLFTPLMMCVCICVCDFCCSPTAPLHALQPLKETINVQVLGVRAATSCGR